MRFKIRSEIGPGPQLGPGGCREEESGPWICGVTIDLTWCRFVGMRHLSVLIIALAVLQGGICSSLCGYSAAPEAERAFDLAMHSDSGEAAPCHSSEQSQSERNLPQQKVCCDAGMGTALVSQPELPSIALGFVVPIVPSLLSLEPTSFLTVSVASTFVQPGVPPDLRLLNASFLI